MENSVVSESYNFFNWIDEFGVLHSIETYKVSDLVSYSIHASNPLDTSFNGLTECVATCATSDINVALKNDGNVVIMGCCGLGGLIIKDISVLTNIKYIASNSKKVGFLSETGTLYILQNNGLVFSQKYSINMYFNVASFILFNQLSTNWIAMHMLSGNVTFISFNRMNDEEFTVQLPLIYTKLILSGSELYAMDTNLNFYWLKIKNSNIVNIRVHTKLSILGSVYADTTIRVVYDEDTLYGIRKDDDNPEHPRTLTVIGPIYKLGNLIYRTKHPILYLTKDNVVKSIACYKKAMNKDNKTIFDMNLDSIKDIIFFNDDTNFVVVTQTNTYSLFSLNAMKFYNKIPLNFTLWMGEAGCYI